MNTGNVKNTDLQKWRPLQECLDEKLIPWKRSKALSLINDKKIESRLAGGVRVIDLESVREFIENSPE